LRPMRAVTFVAHSTTAAGDATTALWPSPSDITPITASSSGDQHLVVRAFRPSE
jgi:hypothetical protein